MTEYANPSTATMNVLRTITDVMNLADKRIAGGEVPSAWFPLMPANGIVVAPAGAGSANADWVPISVSRVSIRCYGTTQLHADQLATAVAGALKTWRGPRTVGRVHIHWFKRNAGPMPLVDPQTGWPMSIVRFEISHADEMTA